MMMNQKLESYLLSHRHGFCRFLITSICVFAIVILVNGTGSARLTEENFPTALKTDSQWQQWQHGRSTKLVQIARQLRTVEAEDAKQLNKTITRLVDTKKLSPEFMEATDARPDRRQSTELLNQALRLEARNLTARCLLVENEIDTAYDGEGMYDPKVITTLLSNLDQIIRQKQNRTLSLSEKQSITALRARLAEEIILVSDNNEPGIKPLRTWWQNHKMQLVIK
jgi:hypothetical protein